jgi:hypothetical protein
LTIILIEINIVIPHLTFLHQKLKSKADVKEAEATSAHAECSLLKSRIVELEATVGAHLSKVPSSPLTEGGETSTSSIVNGGQGQVSNIVAALQKAAQDIDTPGRRGEDLDSDTSSSHLTQQGTSISQSLIFFEDDNQIDKPCLPAHRKMQNNASDDEFLTLPIATGSTRKVAKDCAVNNSAISASRPLHSYDAATVTWK